MRIYEVDEGYQIYLNKDYTKEVDFTSKEEISEYAKSLVLRLRKIYGITLLGYYEVKIYVNKRIGMFIELRKMDDIDFDFFTIDLKIIIYLEQPFFLKCDNFDYIETCHPLYYYKGSYYTPLDKIEHFIPYLELGEIIYKEKIEEVEHFGLCIQK